MSGYRPHRRLGPGRVRPPLLRALPLLFSAAFAACGDATHDHGHDHGHAEHGHAGHAHAPRYGGKVLIELGDHEFQVELLLDAGSGTLTAYLWDGHVERAVPTAMASIPVEAKVGDQAVSLDLKPVASRYGEDATGKASEFAASSEKLRKAGAFEGEIGSLTLAAKTFENIRFRYDGSKFARFHHAAGEAGDGHDDHDDADHDHDHEEEN